jgi:hypothetical protein
MHARSSSAVWELHVLDCAPLPGIACTSTLHCVRVAPISCALLFAALGQPVMAAEWSAAPTLSWGLDHSSNRALSARERSSAAGTMSMNFLMRRVEPTFELAVEPHLSLTRFTHQAAADANDRSMVASGAWLSEHSRLSSNVGYSLQSTLLSELEDTGVVSDSNRRTKNASLSWSLLQSEYRTLQTQLSYVSVDYTASRFGRLPGYRYPSLSIGETFALSERTSFTVSAFGSYLDSPVEGSDSRDSGASVSLDRVLSSQMKAHVSVGYSTRELANVSDQGYIADLELTRQSELHHWNLYYHRRLMASGYGYFVERDEAGLGFTRLLSEALSASFNVRAVRNDNTTLLTSAERRRYESAESALDWRLSETSVIRTTASFTQAQQASGTALLDGWRIAISFNWSPRPRVVSR